MSEQLQIVNNVLRSVVGKYRNVNLFNVMQAYGINPESKGKMRTLTTRILADCGNEMLLSFVSNENVQVKTVKLVRGGTVEASLSMPSFKFCDIVHEEWETCWLRQLLLETVFVLFFYEWPPYQDNSIFLRAAFAWTVPSSILESGIRDCWQTVSECVKAGRIVKYIDYRGKYHTYFPRTADNPYVHVRPHAASTDSTLPLPIPDVLTGLREYPMHSFWIKRSLIEKVYKQYMEAME